MEYNSKTLKEIAQVMKIKVSHDWTHFKYLGVPIAKKSTNSSMWRLVVPKIKKQGAIVGNDMAQLG